MSEDIIRYKEQIIKRVGLGYSWGGMLWPTWEMVTSAIDAFLDDDAPKIQLLR